MLNFRDRFILSMAIVLIWILPGLLKTPPIGWSRNLRLTGYVTEILTPVPTEFQATRKPVITMTPVPYP